jgi:uncharacterized membrane protein
MKREWHLKRNCSMSPRQSALAYGSLCAGVLGVSLVFALYGLWFMLVFAVLETAGVGFALLHYARHATDHEYIALGDGCLLVERVQAGQVQRIHLDPCWTRIAVPTRRRQLIHLESRGVRIEIGAFVSEKLRQQVATELKQELRGNSYLA